MKNSNFTFRLVCAVLIIISIVGLFEESAFLFLKKVAGKNTEFLATISGIKLIVGGLSSINVPFLTGHTQGLEDSLAKAQNFLLLTDSISFIQILFLSLSKSLLFKIGLVVLFLLTFFESKKPLFSKLLIIALAISPGLSIYTTTVHHLSSASKIDFGSTYIAQLKSSAESISKENAELMQQHQQELTKINNGQKGLIILRKLKEDIAYDTKRAKSDLKGDYVHIRSIIKSSGNEMLNKVFRFGTMILFCLLILPLGYTLIIKILMDSLFKNASLNAAITQLGKEELTGLEKDLKKKTFSQRLRDSFKAAKSEFFKAEQIIEHSSEYKNLHQKLDQLEARLKSDANQGIAKAENRIKRSAHLIATDVSQDVNDFKDKVDTDIRDGASKIDNKIKGDAQTVIAEGKDKVDALKSDVQTDVSNAEDKVRDDAQTVATDVNNKIDTVESDTQAAVASAETKVKGDVQKDITKGKEQIDRIKSDAVTDISNADERVIAVAQEEVTKGKEKIDGIKSKVQNDISTEEGKVKNDAQTIVTDTQGKIDTVKSNLQTDVSDVDDKAKADTDDLKNKATDDLTQAKDTIDQTETTIKSDASETINEVKDKAEAIVGDVKQKAQDLPKPKINL